MIIWIQDQWRERSVNRDPVKVIWKGDGGDMDIYDIHQEGFLAEIAEVDLRMLLRFHCNRREIFTFTMDSAWIDAWELTGLASMTYDPYDDGDES